MRFRLAAETGSGTADCPDFKAPWPSCRERRDSDAIAAGPSRRIPVGGRGEARGRAVTQSLPTAYAVRHARRDRSAEHVVGQQHRRVVGVAFRELEAHARFELRTASSLKRIEGYGVAGISEVTVSNRYCQQ